MLSIEVVYATPEKQCLKSLKVPEGTSARDAALLAELAAEFPDLDVAQAALGIFSRHLPDPENYLVKEGDRVEIYRPLICDPKEQRRARSRKMTQ